MISKEDLRQIVQGQAQVAAVISNYYLELKKCGFTEEQAMELTKAYQHSMLNLRRNDDEE